MSPRKFTLVCIGAILVLVGTVGVFNRIVDPYWYFRDIEIAGFNRDKPKAPGNDRLVKPPLLVRLKPEALIVGSSFAEIGLPALHPGFTRNGQLTSFNLGTPAATWGDVYCLAMFSLRQPQMKRMVVGVSGIDSVACPDDDALTRVDYGKLLFSRKAFDASRDTLRQQGRPPAMTREGMWTYGRNVQRLQADDEMAGNFALELAGALCPNVLEVPRPMDAARIRTPSAPGTAAGLRNLIRLALANKVELVLLFYPTHVLFNEIERRCLSPEAHWVWLWDAVIDRARGSGRSIEVGAGLGFLRLRAAECRADARGQADARSALAGFRAFQRGNRNRRLRCDLPGDAVAMERASPSITSISWLHVPRRSGGLSWRPILGSLLNLSSW